MMKIERLEELRTMYILTNWTDDSANAVFLEAAQELFDEVDYLRRKLEETEQAVSVFGQSVFAAEVEGQRMAREAYKSGRDDAIDDAAGMVRVLADYMLTMKGK